jgi:hypothetical protein
MVIGAARELQPCDAQLLKRPPGDEPNRMCRDAAPTSSGHQPVADCCPTLLQVNVVQRAAAEQDVMVVWLDQRELDLLAAPPRLFLLDKAPARVGLGVGRPIVEVLKEPVSECFELRRHIRLAPRPQQHDIVGQMR